MFSAVFLVKDVFASVCELSSPPPNKENCPAPALLEFEVDVAFGFSSVFVVVAELSLSEVNVLMKLSVRRLNSNS